MTRKESIQELLRTTERQLGHTLDTNSDFNRCVLMIRKKLGIDLSPSTLKRLWGYVKSSCTPSNTTLNLLARFNGFNNFAAFEYALIHKEEEEISEYLEESEVDIADLKEGDTIDLRWNPNKGLSIEFIGNNRFRILNTTNIKLQADDIITLNSIVVGNPLCALEIQRGDQFIPGYIGARAGGILRIRINH